jgi:hypothetical protein
VNTLECCKICIVRNVFLMRWPPERKNVTFASKWDKLMDPLLPHVSAINTLLRLRVKTDCQTARTQSVMEKIGNHGSAVLQRDKRCRGSIAALNVSGGMCSGQVTSHW